MIAVVKLFARLHEFFHNNMNINLRGLKLLYRRIQLDFIFEVEGMKKFFNYVIADKYERLLANLFNEPKTHIFLNKVFKAFIPTKKVLLKVCCL